MLTAHLAALGVLFVIVVVDWWRHEIWHALTLPTILLSVWAAQQLPAETMFNALLGATTAFVLFLLIQVVALRIYGDGSFGFGDVMLAAAMGAIGGFIPGLIWLAVGMLCAGGYAAWQMWLGTARDAAIPYGSFLALGGILGISAEILTS